MTIPAAMIDFPGPCPRAALAFELVESLVLKAIIFFVIQTFVAQPFEVRQQSMKRTLEPGQYVLVDKLTRQWDG